MSSIDLVNPSDLPYIQEAYFELVITPKTAKALSSAKILEAKFNNCGQGRQS